MITVISSLPIGILGKSIKNFIEQKTDNHREEVFTEGGRLRLERQASESQSLNLPHGLYYPRVSLQGNEDEIFHAL